MAATKSRKTIEKPALRIKRPQLLTYPSVARPNHLLNQPKKKPSGPLAGFLGRNNRAERAGLRGSALKAEITTDTAMVTANCWYSLPVMPVLTNAPSTWSRLSKYPVTCAGILAFTWPSVVPTHSE